MGCVYRRLRLCVGSGAVGHSAHRGLRVRKVADMVFSSKRHSHSLRLRVVANDAAVFCISVVYAFGAVVGRSGRLRIEGNALGCRRGIKPAPRLNRSQPEPAGLYADIFNDVIGSVLPATPHPCPTVVDDNVGRSAAFRYSMGIIE